MDETKSESVAGETPAVPAGPRQLVGETRSKLRNLRDEAHAAQLEHTQLEHLAGRAADKAQYGPLLAQSEEELSALEEHARQVEAVLQERSAEQRGKAEQLVAEAGDVKGAVDACFAPVRAHLEKTAREQGRLSDMLGSQRGIQNTERLARIQQLWDTDFTAVAEAFQAVLQGAGTRELRPFIEQLKAVSGTAVERLQQLHMIQGQLRQALDDPKGMVAREVTRRTRLRNRLIERGRVFVDDAAERERLEALAAVPADAVWMRAEAQAVQEGHKIHHLSTIQPEHAVEYRNAAERARVNALNMIDTRNIVPPKEALEHFRGYLQDEYLPSLLRASGKFAFADEIERAGNEMKPDAWRGDHSMFNHLREMAKSLRAASPSHNSSWRVSQQDISTRDLQTLRAVMRHMDELLPALRVLTAQYGQIVRRGNPSDGQGEWLKLVARLFGPDVSAESAGMQYVESDIPDNYPSREAFQETVARWQAVAARESTVEYGSRSFPERVAAPARVTVEAQKDQIAGVEAEERLISARRELDEIVLLLPALAERARTARDESAAEEQKRTALVAALEKELRDFDAAMRAYREGCDAANVRRADIEKEKEPHDTRIGMLQDEIHSLRNAVFVVMRETRIEERNKLIADERAAIDAINARIAAVQNPQYPEQKPNLKYDLEAARKPGRVWSAEDYRSERTRFNERYTNALHRFDALERSGDVKRLGALEQAHLGGRRSVALYGVPADWPYLPALRALNVHAEVAYPLTEFAFDEASGGELALQNDIARLSDDLRQAQQRKKRYENPLEWSHYERTGS